MRNYYLPCEFLGDKANSFRMRAGKLSLLREQEYGVTLIKGKMLTMLDSELRKWHQPHPQSKSSAGLRVKADWEPLLSQDYTHHTAGARSPIWEQHKMTPGLSTRSNARYANGKWTWVTAKPLVYQLIWHQEMLGSAKSTAAVLGIFCSWVTKSLDTCQAFQRTGFGVSVTQWVTEPISHLPVHKLNICCLWYIPCFVRASIHVLRPTQIFPRYSHIYTFYLRHSSPKGSA